MNFMKAPIRHEYQQRCGTQFSQHRSSHPILPGHLHSGPEPAKHKDMQSSTCLYFQRPSRLIPVSTKHLSSNCLAERVSTQAFDSLAAKAGGRFGSGKALANNVYRLPKRTLFTTQHAFRLPKGYQSNSQSNPSFRINAEASNYIYEKITKKKKPVFSSEVVHNKNRPLLSQSSNGLAARKPMTAAEARPESRYSHKSLFAALENGRSKSPEYKVPVLRMNLAESKCEEELLPECWK
eukprot:TRINITY_DN7022_c0_g5_i2.p1 TRINITY_DN7022_c0_g5~~TRINITY_DN7022_c0_g5_i2.p1  ORF type:complete len:237 (+),score=35.02 TRINITY_DN7022_c0_g5_i2:1253-1963(+)